jgi:diguanylate cyclase (GGDEF)-like protein
MQRHAANHLPADAAADDLGATGSELGLLRDVLRLLPAGVTVQDAHGEFLIVNDAAAALLGVADGASAALPQLDQRREAGRDALRAGRALVAEECLDDGRVKQTLLTSHRPVRIGGRDLLISSSADISGQKAFEEHLFRSAYYDELTDLPSRRVIEYRANALLRRDGRNGKFALAFLDIDNFKHINDYYGHTVGDTLLIELAKRLGRELRDTDMLARISGDEFLLLLSPVQDQHEVGEFLQSTLERLSAPFFIDGSEIFTSISVGVSLYPDHGESYDVLRHNADLAMYRVKNDARALRRSSTPAWSVKRWRA